MRLLNGHVFQIINKLEAHESKTLSRWRETAEYRQTNKLWLRHSQRIAVIRKCQKVFSNDRFWVKQNNPITS